MSSIADDSGAAETLSVRKTEVVTKLAAVRALLARHGADSLNLTTVASTAWLTAGTATYVNESVETAILSAFVSDSDAIILTDTIEAPRLRDEERLEELGFAIAVEPWYARGPKLAKLSAGKHIANETAPEWRSLQRELAQLRATLTSGEQTRLRAGAQLAAEAMRETVLAIRPGMSESEVAARLMLASRNRGATAVVALVGSDERIANFRHPLATERAIERYVMIVLSFRYHGLIISLTRSIYFGKLPDSLRETAMMVAKVDANVIAATHEGRTLADMFAYIKQQYAEAGQPHAIEEHHQGGVGGYQGREAFAMPTASDWTIKIGQSFAWNPSLRGAKSEDSILLTPSGPEVITVVTDWPTWTVSTPAGVIARPAIREIE
jgi:antitoxin VapB